MDIPILFGEGVKASDFEDYSLARALDKLSEANPKMVFSSVTLQAHGAEEVSIGRPHGDTWECNHWQDIGIVASTKKKDSARYRYQEFTETLYDQEYRFVVVHSSKLDAKKLKTLEKNVAKLREELEKDTEKFAAQRFACGPDAETALAALQKEKRNRFFSIEGQVIPVEQPVKRPHRGRPKKDEPQELETVYRVDVNVGGLDLAAFQSEKERLSCFVLITSIMDTTKDGALILKEYKSQSSVELQFKVIKDPEFVGSMYLKRPVRVEALAYVVLMAVLVKSLI